MNMMVVMVVVMAMVGLKMFWHNSTERVCISTEMLALFELEQKIKFLLKKRKRIVFYSHHYDFEEASEHYKMKKFARFKKQNMNKFNQKREHKLVFKL